MATSKELFEQMKEVMTEMEVAGEKFYGKGTKSAAMKMRKCTSNLSKLGKDFRKLSVEETKK